MKKLNIILLLFGAMMFMGCDPLFHDDFIILNKCSQNIDVSITYRSGDVKDFTVSPQTEYLFHPKNGLEECQKLNLLIIYLVQ